MIANWMITELFAHPEFQMQPETLAELVDMINDGDISSKIAKDIFIKMLDGETGTPREIADKHGLKQMSDTSAIAAIVDEVIASNPAQAAEYRGGKTGLLGFFVGAVMKSTGGTANPAAVNEILREKLK
jgi:aspartyl-tRNA(Asn)/glutamyl-tRNA(Gln) amidotransferase subunit B